jgi:hypothetical protein
MSIFGLEFLYLLLLSFDLAEEAFIILSFARFERLQLRHLDITTIDEVGAKSFESGEDFLLFLLLVRVGVVHDAKIAGSLLVYVGLGAVAANCIGADSAMVLPKEVGEIAKTDDAVGLLLIRVLLLQFEIYMQMGIPGRVRLTVFCPPPVMNDLVCGSSLLMEEFSMDSTSSVSLFLRLIDD